MAHSRRRRQKRFYGVNMTLSLLTLGVFALTGLRVAHDTSAATANPYGSADYCALENNQTVIYGWAADPDASALGQPAVQLTAGTATVTTQTNRANYRDAAINSWITANRGGDPKPGTYGFKVALPGLTKGNHYPVSGTVLNEGPGSNVILNINNSSFVDNDTAKPFFSDNAIPDACLADPALPSPVPVAATALLPSPKTAASDLTGSSVTAGTLAAEIKITSQNTASVRVDYGENPLQLDQSSSDLPARGGEKVIDLTGLHAATSYSFRVIRTDLSGKKTTSPLGNFETLGYVVAAHFVDNRDDGLANISATLDPGSKAKTSDDTGTIEFTNVTSGTHSIAYSYLGKQFSKTFTADPSTISPAQASAAQVITLDYSLNIQQLMAASSAPRQTDNLTYLVIVATAVMCLVIIGIVIWVKYRRQKREEDAWLNEAPPPPLPEYHQLSPQLPPVVPIQPGAAHMGKSLKEIVLQDMRSQR